MKEYKLCRTELTDLLGSFVEAALIACLKSWVHGFFLLRKDLLLLLESIEKLLLLWS